MRVVVTGAHGFLGWHTRARLHAVSDYEIVPIGRNNWNDLSHHVKSADAVIHIAGINRESNDALEHGNAGLARDVASAVQQADAPLRVVYANSSQAGNQSPYGRGKEEAAKILRSAATQTGASFTDVILPNLFGEHGRPSYNSFVATFAHQVVLGQRPTLNDREVDLLHVQDAAQALLEGLNGPPRSTVEVPIATRTTVAEVLATLESQYSVYRNIEIPPLHSPLDVNLFNTLRATMFPAHYPFPLSRRTDHRGSLVETVRAHGSQGQTFLSTTAPGVTRGQHFHLRKFERFAVVAGRARISLRRVLSNETLSFDVDGEKPAVVDMPTLWSHKITNTGSDEVTTMFWTNELFDPQDADTYAEEV